MQLVKIFTKFCCKDGEKVTPILTTCKKFHKTFFTHDKKTITIFAKILKTLHHFLHHAKIFIMFLTHLLKNHRKSRKLKKSFNKYFRIKKNVTRFSCTVENYNL